ENRDNAWTPEQLAIAGAVVSIDYEGKLDIIRGLVRPEDMPKKAKGKSAASTPGVDGAQPSGLLSPLVESLTAHKSAALSASMLDNPDAATAFIAYMLALEIFGRAPGMTLTIEAEAQSLHRVEGSEAFQRFEKHRQHWNGVIPAEPALIWDWCFRNDRHVLID